MLSTYRQKRLRTLKKKNIYKYMLDDEESDTLKKS